MNLSWTTVFILWIVTAVIGGAAWLHHSGEKSEANKIAVKTAAVVQHVQEKKNEIINLPRTDARSIDRLQRGTFFPTR